MRAAARPGRAVLIGVAVVLALGTWGLHRRLVRATRLTGRTRVLVDVALVVLAALALLGFASGTTLDPTRTRPLSFVGLSWLVVVLYLGIGLTVVALGSGIARAARVPEPGRRRALRLATAGVVVAAVGTTAVGVATAATPRVVRVRVPLAKLPAAFEGTTIALVTDLHVGPVRDARFTREVVDLVNGLSPDLVALGGDLVDGTVARIADALAPLADLRAPLGVFGVTGNHEHHAGDQVGWVEHWPTLGIRPLQNERVELRRDGAVVDLAGVHDWTSPAPQLPDLDAALAGRDPERCLLLLAHQPRQVVRAAELGVDLQLSGHTHAGQVWPVRYLVGLQNPTVEGLDRFGDTWLYTSRGAGAWGPPVRVGAPPEVTLLELVRPG